MPTGVLLAVPVPVPACVTVNAYTTALAEKLALTELAAFIVRLQLAAAPVHAPLQPAKVYPLAALALSVTAVPTVKDEEQVLPQEMPPELLVTVPPLPGLATVRV